MCEKRLLRQVNHSRNTLGGLGISPPDLGDECRIVADCVVLHKLQTEDKDQAQSAYIDLLAG